MEVLKPCKKISIKGLHCHLGSTIDDVSIYTQLFEQLNKIISEYPNTLGNVEIVNVGGGLGINYLHDASHMPTINDLCESLPKDSKFTVLVEPGRSLVGNTAVFLTQVIGVKRTTAKTFVVVDGSMTELIRPALYQAFHNILPVAQNGRSGAEREKVDFVGPVCESGDFLGRDREVRLPREGDLFAVMDAGAYCMAMASNYNLRARPAEILVDGDTLRVIGERETYEQVVRL